MPDYQSPIAGFVSPPLLRTPPRRAVLTGLARFRLAHPVLLALVAVGCSHSAATSPVEDEKTLPEALRDGMVPFTANNIRHWDLCQSCVRPMSDYQSLAAPTTVVCGGNSNPIAQTIAKQLHAHIPNSTLTSIEGASHFMVTTHAEACLAAMQCR